MSLKPKNFYENEVYTPGWRLMIVVCLMVFSVAGCINYLVDRSNASEPMSSVCADCGNGQKSKLADESIRSITSRLNPRPWDSWGAQRLTATNTSLDTGVAGQAVSTDNSIGIFSFGNTNRIGVNDGTSDTSQLSIKTTGQVVYVPQITLIPGQTYYHDTSGILTSSVTANRAGIAISAHQLLVLLF